MTDEHEPEGQSRRTFLKTSAAVGATVTGAGAFAGASAAQGQGQNQGNVIQNLTAEQVTDATQQGLANVLVTAQIVDAVDVQNVQVRVGNVLQDVDISVLEEGVTIEDVNVNATVIVQALNAGGQVIDTATTQITG